MGGTVTQGRKMSKLRQGNSGRSRKGEKKEEGKFFVMRLEGGVGGREGAVGRDLIMFMRGRWKEEGKAGTKGFRFESGKRG